MLVSRLGFEAAGAEGLKTGDFGVDVGVSMSKCIRFLVVFGSVTAWSSSLGVSPSGATSTT